MKINEELLQFVLRQYRRGMFDPERALGHFREKVGILREWKMRRALRSFSAAAGVLLVVAGGLWYHRSREYRWEETTSSSVVLPDQSTVRLKEGATLAFQPRRFTRNRIVRLDGVAYFEVKKDAGSSFEIHSKEACVRVLGTKFQFDTYRGEVDLLEGQVLFSRQDSDRGLRMTGKSHAVLTEESVIPVLAEPDLPNPAVWATGRLIYDATPLDIVLNELAVLFEKDVKVLQAAASGASLTGEFLVSDGLESIVSTIESALNLRIIIDNETHK